MPATRAFRQETRETLGGNVKQEGWLIAPSDRILVTGAAGFIGSRVVANLVNRGFEHVRCLVRPGSPRNHIAQTCGNGPIPPQIEIVEGNLLSREDCAKAAAGARIIYHLAAGSGEKSYPDAFLNSVVATRNLLDAALQAKSLLRFVNVSSFAVYSNRNKSLSRWLDEQCPVEDRPELRGDAYTYAKVRQDDLVIEYGRKQSLRYVLVRPGVVYGPGKERITGRVGLNTFGIFLHFGGPNQIPLTYVGNCAEAIVLAGLKPGVEGEVFNIVDDDLPSSRNFLWQYKKAVRPFFSVYVPHFASYLFCWLWESYSNWSEGQLPPAFNRRAWHAYWKRSRYTNRKLKDRLGWVQRVPTREALSRHFEHCRQKERHA